MSGNDRRRCRYRKGYEDQDVRRLQGPALLLLLQGMPRGVQEESCGFRQASEYSDSEEEGLTKQKGVRSLLLRAPFVAYFLGVFGVPGVVSRSNALSSCAEELEPSPPVR